MATITIEFKAPEAPVAQKVAEICPMFFPTNSYVDTEEYEGTVWDTNVEGWGEWDGLAEYLEGISMHKGVLLMFKKAVRDGSVSFDIEDPVEAEYYMEAGRALADFGFTVSDGSNAAGGEGAQG